MGITLLLLGLCGGLLLVILLLAWRLHVVSGQLAELDYRKRSLSSAYGRITEQWFPLLGEYPYDPQDFRFLGSPVDGVQFEEDRIVFVEFKANKSRLSEKQRRIKKLVEEGHVYWEEFRFTDDE
ncbi:MAG: Holliday junction resolvase-like protein [Capsulimonadales bacterium]|nr:Holliday junction resolvase-like protein [Capsulimonadales bacterium]